MSRRKKLKVALDRDKELALTAIVPRIVHFHYSAWPERHVEVQFDGSFLRTSSVDSPHRAISFELTDIAGEPYMEGVINPSNAGNYLDGAVLVSLWERSLDADFFKRPIVIHALEDESYRRKYTMYPVKRAH